MSAIPYVGKCFDNSKDFLAYLEALQWGAWHPGYVVMHHTGGPDLKTWNSWQTRAKPISDAQWMKNLAEYYGSPPPRGPADGPWQRAPQFFFTPKNFCILSIPTARGTHAKSFNANSWAVECVGNFDSEPFDGVIRDRYVEGMACLHLAAGLQLLPFEKKVRGLHFHRDDPLTSKTCPGTKVLKPDLIKRVQAKMVDLAGGEHESDAAAPVPAPKRAQTGTVNTAEGLSVRAGAGTKNPVVRELKKGAKVDVLGIAMNGATKWLNIAPGEWVAARYVNL